ncbi:DODA-type extradiol aromatic ring-opening family dioxygenase [Asaia spathodeae]|uniref:Dioxygenase n=1 Tax=Asaia spathodeae TaxID=657016 RepID=A0ABX2P4Y2_9PROT|nr:class III extradiol ring-cleavage dioxygenase [Asaia spathodeae]GBR22376.1 aromatic ring-opening dioxygenase catalytic subunit LigB [Asaia spathodeae NBRC 105894]
MQPSFFINHGGGPCFFLEPGPMRRAWAPLEDYLAGFAARLPKRPDALVVISGHWEDRVPRIHFGGSPSLLYDYGGFPPHTYALEWPAPGSPPLAARIATLLDDAGIETARETARGWDHGVFVPLKIAFPNAEIPVVQLSLRQDLDPRAHLALGHALAPLRAENVLIIGSGQSYHNINGFFSGTTSDPAAEAFDHWLQAAMQDPATREQALCAWRDAPGARAAHPREEHLLPLMVAAGAAPGEATHLDFAATVLGKPLSGFRFG